MNRKERSQKEQDRHHREGGEPRRGVVSTGDEGSHGHGRAERMSLAELTDAADVSVRTVRYYIAEGLLPPPEGSGPASAYSPGHLARLRLIQRLKDAYLPLREIRRRLSGLEDDEVLAILSHEEATSSEALLAAPLDASLAGARDYLALLETRAKYRTEPLGLSIPAAPSASAPAVARAAESYRSEKREAPGAEEIVGDHLLLETAFDAGREALQDPSLWRRIPLGDEAELVISDRVYGRHRDRIDWLVRWARKVFD